MWNKLIFINELPHSKKLVAQKVNGERRADVNLKLDVNNIYVLPAV